MARRWLRPLWTLKECEPLGGHRVEPRDQGRSTRNLEHHLYLLDRELIIHSLSIHTLLSEHTFQSTFKPSNSQGI